MAEPIYTQEEREAAAIAIVARRRGSAPEGVPWGMTPSGMPSVRIRKFVTFLKDNFEAELDALTTRRKRSR